MVRKIEVKVFGNHLTKDNKNAGVRGEANVTNLRITFDEGWDDYEKEIIFWDAYGENAVKRVLTTDFLENAAKSTRIYIMSIPKEAMARAGMLTFQIRGCVDNKVQASISTQMEVTDSKTPLETVDPTPTELQQIQTEVEKIKGDIQATAKAKEAIENMGVSAETLETGEEAFVIKTVENGVVILHYGLPKGNTGDSGVHVGSDEPLDPVKNVWIDPNGSATNFVGKSAYEIAVEYGFRGTEEEWLASLTGAGYILTADDKEDIAEIVDDDSSVVEVVLSASGWQGTASPYTQVVSVAGITPDTEGVVVVSEGATDQQFMAATYAMLRKTAQGTDSITIKAYGEKPTVDIPLSVTIGG